MSSPLASLASPACKRILRKRNHKEQNLRMARRAHQRMFDTWLADALGIAPETVANCRASHL